MHSRFCVQELAGFHSAAWARPPPSRGRGGRGVKLSTREAIPQHRALRQRATPGDECAKSPLPLSSPPPGPLPAPASAFLSSSPSQCGATTAVRSRNPRGEEPGWTTSDWPRRHRLSDVDATNSRVLGNVTRGHRRAGGGRELCALASPAAWRRSTSRLATLQTRSAVRCACALVVNALARNRRPPRQAKFPKSPGQHACEGAGARNRCLAGRTPPSCAEPDRTEAPGPAVQRALVQRAILQAGTPVKSCTRYQAGAKSKAEPRAAVQDTILQAGALGKPCWPAPLAPAPPTSAQAGVWARVRDRKRSLLEEPLPRASLLPSAPVGELLGGTAAWAPDFAQPPSVARYASSSMRASTSAAPPAAR